MQKSILEKSSYDNVKLILEKLYSDDLDSITEQQPPQKKIEDILLKLDRDENTDQVKKKVVFSATDLVGMDVSVLPTLLEPIFPKVGIIGLAGASDGGKSASLRHFAVAVALGQSEWIGFKIHATHKKAIYVSSEDDENSIAYLLQKLNKEYKLKPEAFSGLKFITDTENLLQRLTDMLEDEPVDLIVLDTFGDLYGKSMNESNQVRSFLNEFSQIAQKYKCLIVVLHHTGKKTEEYAPSKNNLLGSQGFESKMRVVVEMRLDKHYHDRRHFCIVKANYLPREYKESSYVLSMNENFHFSFTGERVPFSELAGEDNNQKIEFEENVLALDKSGMTQTEIAVQLKVSQATVSRVLKKNRNQNGS